MKKLISFLLMCIVALSMNAQRCAVLEFKAGAGISQADVDGISAIFITYFRPAGYTMVERTQIDKAIDEQGFQRSKMTESQMVRIGQILNVSKIVVGDVNVVMGQYNVDVRVINVESGTQSGWAGDSFTASSYRATMQQIAQQLAEQIAIKPARQNKSVGMYVDLGLPSGTLWKRINESGYFDYDTAMQRFGDELPTKEQFEELIALCQSEWTGDGYKLVGPNGESIFMKAEYVQGCDGNFAFEVKCTAFRSSTTTYNDSERAYTLYFIRTSSGEPSSLHIFDTMGKCNKLLVRLVR